MMMKNAITASKNANCTDFADNSIIPIFHSNKHQSPLSGMSLEEDKDENADANNPLEEAVESLMFEHLDRGIHSDFISNILFYIGGFIVSKLVKKLTCQACIDCLVGSINRAESDHDYCEQSAYNEVSTAAAFTLFVNNGGLRIPSKYTIKFLPPLNSVNTSSNNMFAKTESATPKI